MTHAGYYRFPTIHGDRIVFVSDDDLWSVGDTGGIPCRLTANRGSVSHPALSPTGDSIAFTGEEDGDREVYVVSARGGEHRRVTFLGSHSVVAGWGRDGQTIIFSSNHRMPFVRTSWLHEVDADGGLPRRLELGPAQRISFGPDGATVLGRYLADPAARKRYRGGRVGQLWIDRTGEGDYRRLIALDGNFDRPMWVGSRIYFLCDHEGIGNLYSCEPTGEDLRRHTHHGDFYARGASSDGSRIVYHAGADLFVYDPKTEQSSRLEIDFRSPRLQRTRTYVDTGRYLEAYQPHPRGHSVALTARGRTFSMPNWEHAAIQLGIAKGVRHRLARWLPDGERVVAVSDARGEEGFEIHSAVESHDPIEVTTDIDVGHVEALEVSPVADRIVISNHRRELIVGDLTTGEFRVIDRSEHHPTTGVSWSPDGRYVTYDSTRTLTTSIIRIADVDRGTVHDVTSGDFLDRNPRFSPDGRYLFFLSDRDYDPVYDAIYFNLSFPRSTRPYLITLREDVPNPFIPVPHAPESFRDRLLEKTEPEARAAEAAIDFDGIARRIVAFPVEEGIYEQVWGIEDAVLFSTFPVQGSLGRNWWSEGPPPADGVLEIYDFKQHEKTTLVNGITDFQVAHDNRTVMYRAGDRLRSIPAQGANEPDARKSAKDAPGRESGWLDLGRVKVEVDPAGEWKQMFREAWRLQRNHFWVEDLSGVDWDLVYERYVPLTERVSTRGELADLLWELQGELGTSHAYEFLGDYGRKPDHRQGHLGVDMTYDPATNGFEITRLYPGDVWSEKASSPLARVGVNVVEGDRILGIGGRKVGPSTTPEELLVNHAGDDVMVRLLPKGGGAPRTVCVRTLKSEVPLRYRHWVEANRDTVHTRTGGRVGYVHIPDMGPNGFSEFHRYFLTEWQRDGLIVDVRFNGGGHVSQLLLEKLSRKAIGFKFPRYGKYRTYPENAPCGPLVGITNESAGSDGDIFTHSFRVHRLGPMIGTRTWGGVIGIWPRRSLVDGGLTTQPEYASWFYDVEWGIENHGAEVDIEVDIRPQDYAAGVDPQLDRAIAECLRLLEEQPPEVPEPGPRPQLPLPSLPPWPKE